MPIRLRQSVPRQPKQLTRRDVAEGDVIAGERPQVLNPPRRSDSSSKIGETTAQRASNRLRASTWDWPSNGMQCRTEQHAGGSAHRFIEAEHGMRSQARE